MESVHLRSRVLRALCAAVGCALAAIALTGGVARADAPLAWTSFNIEGQNNNPGDFTGLSCPSSALCVAVDESANVITSTNPTGGAGAWSIHALNGISDLQGVSCPSASLCVALDSEGDIVTS